MKKNRIVILGCGESGIGSSLLALKKGYSVYVSDNGIIKEKTTTLNKTPKKANYIRSTPYLDKTEKTFYT